MDQDVAEIVRKCQAGDLERFTELFDLYHNKIYAFIYYRTHHKETAEDLTSLVFMKALEKIRSYNPAKGVFSSWLYQIARNGIIDHYRSVKPAEDIEAAWDIADGDVHIERDVDAQASLAKVQEFLQTLPKQQRDIVVMRVWDGLSHKEIAEILNISEANAKMTFSRAIAKVNKEAAIVLAYLLFMTLK